MSDRLDSELSGHIRAVFDAYDEPYDAANWQRLQGTMQKRSLVRYLKRASAAAVLALLLAAGALFLFRQPGEDLPFAAPETALAPEGEAAPESVLTPGGETAGQSSSAQEALASGAEPGHENGPGEGAGPAEGKSSVLAGLSRQETPGRALAEDDGSGEPALAGRDDVAGVQPDRSLPAELAAAEKRNPDESSDREPVIASQANGNDPKAQLPEEGRQAVASQSAREPASARDLAATEEHIVLGDDEGSREEGRNRFRVGFVTTSLMNFADGNTGNQVNFGAGISSGLRLNDKLSLQSGLLLAGNSLSLDRSNSSVRTSTYVMEQAGNTALSSASRNNLVQEVSPNSMDVNLLVLDIPLNLSYRVGLGRSDLLITGGVSSFAYLDQEYSYSRTLQLFTDASVEAPEPLVRSEKAFSHFDLAKQLNLAIGTEVSLGKGSFLIVEPYVKYPLGELTSEKIRFGSAGMNLRLSFGKE